MRMMRRRSKLAFDWQHPVIRWQGGWHSLAGANLLALREQQVGNFPEAAKLYRLILARAPDCAEIHNNLGAALQECRRPAEALASYHRAIALKPDYANAHFNRGGVLKALHRPEEALAAYDRAIALKPDHAEAQLNRGVLLQEMRRNDEALAGYDRALAIQPDHAAALHNRGTLLVSRGEMPAAAAMFRRSLELRPDFADPLFSLANLRFYRTAGSAEERQIRARLDRPEIPAGDREQLRFALGKICDDSGRYEEAFACFQKANQLRNAQVSYDAGAVARLTDRLREVFSAEFLARPFPFGSEDETPVFIVGMPRSGTTLLASSLSNHGAIATAGELSTLTGFTGRLRELTRRRTPWPEAARLITPAVAERLIQEYGQRLRRDLHPSAGATTRYVIDKNPLNFRHLGLIRMLFPQARIFHCTRHPLDTGLSNYFQRFPLHLDYSFDLRNLGHFYAEYARLMGHWRQVPGLRLREVAYEDLVLDTEQTIRRALDFLGLDWDERCLAPHTNPGPVETASQWQVRQPIYRHAVGRWRHYEVQLAPLKEALGWPPPREPSGEQMETARPPARSARLAERAADLF